MFLKVIFIVIAVFGFGFFIYCIINHIISKKIIKESFTNNSVIVFGRKGRGKDLIFQLAINLRKKPYLANLSYGGNYSYISPKDLELGDNDYNRLINNELIILDKNKYPFENQDIYFSDAGIIFPSQYDTLLHRTYKTFSVSYALSRHLWNNNIHCNTQSLSRVWKTLREQADYYIKCRKTIKLPFFLCVRFTTYEKYSSAEQELLPYKKSMFNKDSKANKEQFDATNGIIENHFVFIRKKTIKYDTRAYHKKIFGITAKDWTLNCTPPGGRCVVKKAPKEESSPLES